MINYVNIVGHVGRKPEVKVFASGKRLAKFSIAVNQPKRGDEPQPPLWLDIEAWESVAERVIKSKVDAGKKIAISGSLAPNVYQQRVGDSFKEIQKVKVKLSSFDLLSSKPEPEYETSPAAYEMEEPLTVYEQSRPKESTRPVRAARRSA
jgi:single-strand DNA-binding protein